MFHVANFKTIFFLQKYGKDIKMYKKIIMSVSGTIWLRCFRRNNSQLNYSIVILLL